MFAVYHFERRAFGLCFQVADAMPGEVQPLLLDQRRLEIGRAAGQTSLPMLEPAGA